MMLTITKFSSILPMAGRQKEGKKLMKFGHLEKVIKKMQVMNNRADVSFEDIEFEKEASIGYKSLWVVVNKGFSRDDYMTMYIHVSRFDGDKITARMKMSKINDYKGTVIYERMINVDTISAASDLIECVIQAFIA